MNSSQHPGQVNANTGSQEFIELFRTADELGEIVVSQQADKRLLSFASSLQQSSLFVTQPEKLVHEYTQIMLLGLIFNTPRHITVLGLGGGGLAHCLHHFFPQFTLQFVELRQAVIDIAYQWFDLPKSPQLQVACDDAYDYLCSAVDKNTDLILSDLLSRMHVVY